MPLKIHQVCKEPPLYEAQEIRLGGDEIVWQTDETLPMDGLIALLSSRGWHQTDIGDALYEVDPKLIGL